MHFFKDLPYVGDFHIGKHWQLWMGIFIVAVVILAPRGLLGLLERRKAAKAEGDKP
jgi:branched-chain amino acid transport system permease protein